VYLNWTSGAHAAETGYVIVVAAQEHGASGRAEGGCVELSEEHPLRGKRIDVRRSDVTAIDPEVRVSKVVRDEQEKIRPWVEAGLRSARGNGKEDQ
jgi:hypothetical protein